LSLLTSSATCIGPGGELGVVVEFCVAGGLDAARGFGAKAVEGHAHSKTLARTLCVVGARQVGGLFGCRGAFLDVGFCYRKRCRT
jgi:hypothetical protein